LIAPNGPNPQLEDVTLLTASFNTRLALELMLKSFASLHEGPLKVFVVDNGSTDGTVEFLKENGIPHLALDANIGHAPAVEIGLGYCHTKYVLLVDTDVRFTRSVFSGAIQVGSPVLGEVDPSADRIDPAFCLFDWEQLKARGVNFDTGSGEEAGVVFLRSVLQAGLGVQNLVGSCFIEHYKGLSWVHWFEQKQLSESWRPVMEPGQAVELPCGRIVTVKDYRGSITDDQGEVHEMEGCRINLHSTSASLEYTRREIARRRVVLDEVIPAHLAELSHIDLKGRARACRH
jgi:hypothetical protein